MNSEEKRVLHGLYYHREMVGEAIPFVSNEIVWLTRTKLPNTRNWRKQDGSLRSAEEKAANHLATVGATSARAERPLSYLQQSGFIDYTIQGGMFRISVTAKGADLARELDTRWGRFNVIYKEHKEGAVSLLLTVLVSLVTALLTSLLIANK